MGPASQPRGQGSRAMMMHALAALVHLIAAVGAGAPMPNHASDNLSQPVLDHIAGPLLTSAQFLIPSAVAISGIHKMMDHRQEHIHARDRGHEQPAARSHRRTRSRRRSILARGG